MDDIKFADLNDIQDFFNSASPTEKPNSNPIDVKNFIGWCNELRDYYPKSKKPDPAYRLGKTICVLNELDSDVLDNLRQILNDTDVSEARSKLLDCDELISKLKNNRGTISDELAKELPGNIAFYFALKLRLKDCPDEQSYYHYQFDDSGNTIARVDPLKPFTDSALDNLNQQWHVLISLLAFLDVAHALSNEQHEYHCLYPYLSSYDIDDKGDCKKRCLRLGWQKVNGKYCHALEVVKISQDKTPIERIGRKQYHSGAMMDWIEDALTGKLASENPK